MRILYQKFTRTNGGIIGENQSLFRRGATEPLSARRDVSPLLCVESPVAELAHGTAAAGSKASQAMNSGEGGGAAEGEGLLVDVEELRLGAGEHLGHGLDPELLLERTERRESAGEHHVHRARVAHLLGRDLHRVDEDQALPEGLLHLAVEIVGRLLLSGRDSHRNEVQVVYERCPALGEDAGVPERLDLVERHEDVGRALLDDRGGDGRAEAHLARHRAAALGHAVDLGLLDVHSRDGRGLCEYVCGEDDALSADADERNVNGLHIRPPAPQ